MCGAVDTMSRDHWGSVEDDAPEEHRIVHALGHKPALVLDLLAELVEGVLLGHREVAEPPWLGPVIGVCDAVWHCACAGRLLVVAHAGQVSLGGVRVLVIVVVETKGGWYGDGVVRREARQGVTGALLAVLRHERSPR